MKKIKVILGAIDNERFRESFDEEYQKITGTLNRYLDGIANQNIQAQD